MHGCWKRLVIVVGAAWFVWPSGAGCAGLVFADPPSARPLAEAPAVAAPPAREDREFQTADELLEALERADDGLVSLTAHVQYDRTAAIADDHQVNIGRLYFVTGLGMDGEKRGQRKFAVQFRERIVDRVVRPEESMYIFDGEWLIEKHPRERLFIKRQVVPPGESFDPLRIGEGPMPLPIGQKRAEILEQYTAELLDPLDGLGDDVDLHPDLMVEIDHVRALIENAYQIRLVPHPHTAQQNDFREVRLWYIRGADGHLLPRMARTVTRSEDESLVRLFDVQVQKAGEKINPDAQVQPDVLDTSPPGRGWHVQQTDWRGRAPGAGEEQNGG